MAHTDARSFPDADLPRTDVWLNTAAYASIVALLWVMVRAKFLFRIIPT